MMVAPVGYVNHSTIDNVTDFLYNVLAIERHDVTPDSPLPCPSSGVSIYSEVMLFCQVIACVFHNAGFIGERCECLRKLSLQPPSGAPLGSPRPERWFARLTI